MAAIAIALTRPRPYLPRQVLLDPATPRLLRDAERESISKHFFVFHKPLSTSTTDFGIHKPIQAVVKGWSGTWKERVWNIVDGHPELIKTSFEKIIERVIRTYIGLMVVLSAVAASLETMPELEHVSDTAWITLEMMCTLSFSLEISVRVTSAPSRSQLIRALMTWVDILALFPFYAELIIDRGRLKGGFGSGSGVSAFRVLRCLRMLRLLKGVRYSQGLQIFATTIFRSLEALWVLGLLLCMFTLGLATLQYYAERGTYSDEIGDYVRPGEDTPSPFRNIPNSLWWAIVTLTSVGYGDMTPITPQGKVIASLAAVIGVMVVSMPVSIIGVHLKEVVLETQLAKEMETLQKERQKKLEQSRASSTNKSGAASSSSAPTSSAPTTSAPASSSATKPLRDTVTIVVGNDGEDKLTEMQPIGASRERDMEQTQQQIEQHLHQVQHQKQQSQEQQHGVPDFIGVSHPQHHNSAQQNATGPRAVRFGHVIVGQRHITVADQGLTQLLRDSRLSQYAELLSMIGIHRLNDIDPSNTTQNEHIWTVFKRPAAVCRFYYHWYLRSIEAKAARPKTTRPSEPSSSKLQFQRSNSVT
eukprot:c8644_g1_i1.p1 GENE.c8644_g1_i1~~c8644_g1_i1.p1  ORF type:complete len:587 (-),score=122.60 c8644_g1_i1:116-1876(-)